MSDPKTIRDRLLQHGPGALTGTEGEQLAEALNCAWEELRLIRQVIHANPEESTFDEVCRVVAERDRSLATPSSALARLEQARAAMRKHVNRNPHIVRMGQRFADQLRLEIDHPIRTGDTFRGLKIEIDPEGGNGCVLFVDPQRRKSFDYLAKEVR